MGGYGDIYTDWEDIHPKSVGNEVTVLDHTSLEGLGQLQNISFRCDDNIDNLLFSFVFV